MLGNQRVSSVRGVMGNGPPLLTSTSKPGTRATDEFCDTVRFELFNGYPQCITTVEWSVVHSGGTNIINVAATPPVLDSLSFTQFTDGSNVNAYDSKSLIFDLSTLPIAGSDNVTLNLKYTLCSATTEQLAIPFSFIRCLETNTFDLAKAEALQLKVTPNPARQQALIQYELEATEPVQIQIFNTSGQLVETVLNHRQNAGLQQIELDVVHLPKGLYFLQLQTSRQRLSKKLVVVE
ncbi:MAG: T9SS type A sorting domain-containing protein [Bacteroidota bacterium]